MNAESITLLDGTVLFVLLVAIARGGYIGMIRESFSIAAVGASCIALRFGNEHASGALVNVSGGEIGAGVAPFITGAVILFSTIALIGILGRQLKRGARAVGLGWADRVAGSALGMAEGALIATLVVMGATLVFGPEHSSIENSRSVEAVNVLQEYVLTNYGDELEKIPDVAAPFQR